MAETHQVVLVCGGRGYADRARVYAVLDELIPSLVIHGGAQGADRLAAEWAAVRNRLQKAYRADWATYGRAAGYIRNQQMLDDGEPELVVAFPGGRGTADMVRRARAAGVPVREVSDDAPTRPRRTRP